MNDKESAQKKKNVKEVKRKAKELEQAMAKTSDYNGVIPSSPGEKVMKKAQELSARTSESPRHTITTLLIVGAFFLVITVLIAIALSSSFIWILLLGLFILAILSDKVSSNS